MIKDFIYFFLPALICYIVTIFCSVGSKAGSNVKFRPPSVVFGIIWPLLFILFGLSWVFAMRNTENQILCFSLYLFLTLSLAFWIFMYGCKKDKKISTWILIISITLGFMCLVEGNYVSKMLVCPLIAWCIFAQIMNSTEVQIEL